MLFIFKLFEGERIIKMGEKHSAMEFSTYHKLFVFLLLLAILISFTVYFKHYCRGQIAVNIFKIKNCQFMHNISSKKVNIVSLIRGDKKTHLTLLKFDPVGYQDMELIESYFYRGQRKDIPVFGEIPKDVKQKFSQINGAVLKPNTKTEYDYVVWVFKITGSKPKGPIDNYCEIRWLCLNIAK